ncbi:hypothetical protein CBL_08156 [Carabus blaptoides fortunei]
MSHKSVLTGNASGFSERRDLRRTECSPVHNQTATGFSLDIKLESAQCELHLTVGDSGRPERGPEYNYYINQSPDEACSIFPAPAVRLHTGHDDSCKLVCLLLNSNATLRTDVCSSNNDAH